MLSKAPLPSSFVLLLTFVVAWRRSGVADAGADTVAARQREAFASASCRRHSMERSASASTTRRANSSACSIAKRTSMNSRSARTRFRRRGTERMTREKMLPPGKYSAHGFVVGDLKIEGVGFFFNDWVTAARFAAHFPDLGHWRCEDDEIASRGRIGSADERARTLRRRAEDDRLTDDTTPNLSAPLRLRRTGAARTVVQVMTVSG